MFSLSWFGNNIQFWNNMQRQSNSIFTFTVAYTPCCWKRSASLFLSSCQPTVFRQRTIYAALSHFMVMNYTSVCTWCDAWNFPTKQQRVCVFAQRVANCCYSKHPTLFPFGKQPSSVESLANRNWCCQYQPKILSKSPIPNEIRAIFSNGRD